MKLLYVKVALFAYIVISPFINYQYISFMNTLPVKILLLLALVGASFIDLHLAIIATLAFLVLMINMNYSYIQSKKKEFFSAPVPTPQKTDNMTEFPDTCQEYKPHDLSENLISMYIDPKIKPYEMYVKSLTTPEALEEASNSKIIGWD